MNLEHTQSEDNQTEQTINVNHDELMTPNDVAIKLKVTPEQIRCLIRKGQLPAINVGSGKKRPLYRIAPKVLNDFLNHRWQPAPGLRNRKFKRLSPVPDFFPKLK